MGNSEFQTSGASYINNFWEFLNHTKLHQKRVYLLGLALLDRFPEKFPDVPKEILSEFLRHHDQAKFLPLQTTGTTVIEALYEFYGSKDQIRLEKELRPRVIRHMNALEDEMADRFFQRRLLFSADLRAQVLLIEHIADLVDRGLCPVSKEEFGQALIPASSYLQVPEYQQMAEELERHYEQIVGEWTYEKQLQ